MPLGEFVQRCVRRGARGGHAHLQNVLGGILGVQVEGVNGPGLHRADAGSRRELMFSRLVEKMDRRLDVPAAAHMQTRAMLAVNRVVMLAVQRLRGLVDEDEGFCIEIDAETFIFIDANAEHHHPVHCKHGSHADASHACSEPGGDARRATAPWSRR